MLPLRGTDNLGQCPFGNDFNPPVTTCIEMRCMAWDVQNETKELPVGVDAGPGWEKDGPDMGIGGAVTHRPKWKRDAGRCGRVHSSGR